jgi:hypothetical protein
MSERTTGKGKEIFRCGSVWWGENDEGWEKRREGRGRRTRRIKRDRGEEVE